MQVTAILSPHFDDAVLSCWHLLTAGGEVRVVNVFTGCPANGRPGWWDRLTGAPDPVARVREREAEDAEALAAVGRSAIHLGFCDAQHRPSEQALAPVVESLRAALPAGARLALPAALDRHSDHVLVRDAGLALRDEGFDLLLYADLPHGIEYGWPQWVTGVPADPLLDVAASWEATLEGAGLDPAGLSAEAHPLDRHQRERKLATVRLYRTQWPALNRWVRLESPEALGYEVTWRLASR